MEILCALCRPHFLTDFFQILYRCASKSIYTPIVFGDAAPSFPSFIGSKVILVYILVCAPAAAFLDGFLSNFAWRCTYLGKIYTSIVFGVAALRTKGWHKNRCQCRGIHSHCAAMEISSYTGRWWSGETTTSLLFSNYDSRGKSVCTISTGLTVKCIWFCQNLHILLQCHPALKIS